MQATAACRRGFTHGCRIAVTIGGVEADLISKATRRPVATADSPLFARKSWRMKDLAAKLSALAGKPFRPAMSVPCRTLINQRSRPAMSSSSRACIVAERECLRDQGSCPRRCSPAANWGRYPRLPPTPVLHSAIFRCLQPLCRARGVYGIVALVCYNGRDRNHRCPLPPFALRMR